MLSVLLCLFVNTNNLALFNIWQNGSLWRNLIIKQLFITEWPFNRIRMEVKFLSAFVLKFKICLNLVKIHFLEIKENMAILRHKRK